MTFAATTFLYLLPLAGLPIVFHLILRQKKRTVVFSTLMFFHRVDPKLNTRRRIREWLNRCRVGGAIVRHRQLEKQDHPRHHQSHR